MGGTSVSLLAYRYVTPRAGTNGTAIGLALFREQEK